MSVTRAPIVSTSSDGTPSASRTSKMSPDECPIRIVSTTSTVPTIAIAQQAAHNVYGFKHFQRAALLFELGAKLAFNGTFGSGKQFGNATTGRGVVSTRGQFADLLYIRLDFRRH